MSAKAAFWKAFRAVGLGGYGANIRVRSSDRFIVGYPKSGNTWLDFLIASLLIRPNETVNFETINAIVGDVHAVSPFRLLLRPTPRFLKSHAPFDPRPRRVVYIARHPYAVAESYFYFLKKLSRLPANLPLEAFVRGWVTGELGGHYGLWGAHVEGWLTECEPGRLHLLRYEELKADTVGTLAAVADFLSIDTTPEQIAQAVQACSAENMARLERTGMAKGFKHLVDARADIPFVRDSASLEREALSSEDKRLIAQAFGPAMQRLGYQP